MTEAERLLREARAYLANLSINVIGNHCYEIVQQLDAYLARPEPQAVSGETPETDAMWRGKNIDLTQGVVPLSFARSLERRLREAEEALDNAGVAKGAFGHSLRYRIGLLIERAEAAERGPSAEVTSLHDELLMAVEKKFPNESRHNTALRYIRERESVVSDPKVCDAAHKEILRLDERMKK